MDEGVGEDLGQLLLGLDLLPRRREEGHETGIVDAFDGCHAVLGRCHEREPIGFAASARRISSARTGSSYWPNVWPSSTSDVGAWPWCTGE